MLDMDMAAFYESTARPVGAWKAGLTRWADLAVSRARVLAVCQPHEHDALLDAAYKLRSLLEPSAPESRESIASLCSFILASASALHELVIPTSEQRAHDAARALDDAALLILDGLEGDYGNLSAA